jgi:hypothetical protein
MDERTCVKCGANSAAGAEYCWQCYTPFGVPAAVSAPTSGGPLTAALGRGPGAGTPAAVLTDPATVTRWQPIHGSARETGLRWLVRGLVFVAAAAAGYVGYQWLFGGFPFPDEVAGQGRMESAQARDIQEYLAEAGDLIGLEYEAAFYGDGPLPRFVMHAVVLPDGRNGRQVWKELDTAAGGVMDPYPVAPGADVGCADASTGEGALCVWVQDDVLVELDGLGLSAAELEPLADQVRGEL